MTPWPDVVSFAFRGKYSTLSAKMEDISSDLKMQNTIIDCHERDAEE